MPEMMQAQGAGEGDMDVEQIDIRALERVSPRTSLMAPEQVLRSPTAFSRLAWKGRALQDQRLLQCSLTSAFGSLVLLLVDFHMQQAGSCCVHHLLASQIH